MLSGVRKCCIWSELKQQKPFWLVSPPPQFRWWCFVVNTLMSLKAAQVSACMHVVLQLSVSRAARPLQTTSILFASEAHYITRVTWCSISFADSFKCMIAGVPKASLIVVQQRQVLSACILHGALAPSAATPKMWSGMCESVQTQ
jgi:hypothetical protein